MQRSAIVRTVLAALALVALSAAMIPVVESLGESILEFAVFSNDSSRLPRDLAFFVIAMLLCLFSPRRCGLVGGERERWRKFSAPLALVFAVPPLLVVSVYGPLTERPFAGSPWSMWLLESAAQELFFAGFVYARSAELFGEPGLEPRVALHPALLFTAFCFTAWHWPNIRYLSREYLVFQGIYTFLGMLWTLQMRRWTGSLWPGVANHVLVNGLATIV